MKTEKLGRNPFKKTLNKELSKSTTSVSALNENKLDRLPFIEKIQELGLEVDWEEFLKATIGSRLHKFSKYFLRF